MHCVNSWNVGTLTGVCIQRINSSRIALANFSPSPVTVRETTNDVRNCTKVMTNSKNVNPPMLKACFHDTRHRLWCCINGFQNGHSIQVVMHSSNVLLFITLLHRLCYVFVRLIKDHLTIGNRTNNGCIVPMVNDDVCAYLSTGVGPAIIRAHHSQGPLFIHLSING